MNNPITPDQAERAHDLIVELSPYQATLDLVEYLNRSERPLAEFQALMSAFLSMLNLHPDDMNDALCAAFSQFEAAAGIKWWNGLTEEMRLYWLKDADSAVPADAYRMYLERSRGQGQTEGLSVAIP